MVNETDYDDTDAISRLKKKLRSRYKVDNE